MEGKALLFKSFAGVDAFPICLNTTDVDKIVEIVTMLEPVFGGINLEDIAAPACFEVERKLKERLSIPVFHDDQHGTAVIVLAALLNALKITGKELADISVVINGAGAAGIAIVKIMLSAGVKNIIICDRKGIIYQGRPEGMNWAKEEMAEVTNKENKKGDLAAALVGADVFIGVSTANVVTPEMVESMNKDPIIFALANPVPEIDPKVAKEAGARVVGTGRSDYPNQINNVLAFPGIFRGALDVRATDINEEMKLAAARALAEIIPEEELSADYIIPKPFDPRVAPAVARAVAEAARESGVARVK
jgi:malate dehydrogenase (oxaloacetate-decarboxylating)